MVCFDNFQWISQGCVHFEDNNIVMTVPAPTEFFCSGETSSEEGIEHKTVKNIRAGE